MPTAKETLPRRCWRSLRDLVPPLVRTRLKAAARSAWSRLMRKPPSVPEDELRLQLDGVLRELRRVHARLEELHELLEDRAGQPARRRHGEEAA